MASRILLCLALPVMAMAAEIDACKALTPGTLLGQGQLTAFVDDAGALRAIRWPDPLGPLQTPVTALHPENAPAVSWGIALGGELIWLRPDAWHTAVVESSPAVSSVAFTHKVHPLRIRLDTFVRVMEGDPEGEWLVQTAHIVKGPEDGVRFAWHGQLAPSNEHRALLPFTGEALPEPCVAAQVFARPPSAGADSAASPVVLLGGSTETTEDALILTPGTLDQHPAAAVAFRFGGGAPESVASAVRRTWLQPAREAYRRAAEAALGDLTLLPEDLAGRAHTAYGFLRAATTLGDAGAGVAHMAGASGAHAAHWTRYGHWTWRAYHMLGAIKKAEMLLLASAASVADGMGVHPLPVGWLPLARRAAGDAASPAHWYDMDAAAGFLTAVTGHARGLSPDDRTAFLEQAGPPALAVTDFAMRWWDAQEGRPLPAFDPSFLRDTRRPAQLLTAFAVVQAGLEIAGALSEPPPEWRKRRAELSALIEHELLTPNKRAWRVSNPLFYWTAGFREASEPVWEPLMDEALALPSPGDTAAAAGTWARLAATAVMLWERGAGRSPEHVKALEEGLLRASQGAAPVCSCGAAQQVIALKCLALMKQETDLE